MIQKHVRFFFLLAFVAAIGAGFASGDDWMKWRGPGGNGISNETKWNPKALNGTPRVLWRQVIGRGHSAVTIAGGLAFTMGENIINAGGKKTYEEAVICLDANTGKEIWRYAYPGHLRDWPGPASTPLADGPYLYTLGREGELYCFQARDGRVIWRRNLTSENLARLPNWQHCTSPVVSGDLLILNAGRAGLAFNKKTGKTVWTSEAAAGGLSTPVFFEQNGNRLAAFYAGGNLNAVNVNTGKLEWTFPWQTDADPILCGSKIFLSGGGRGASCVMLDLTGSSPQKVWEATGVRYTFMSGVALNGYVYLYGFSGNEQMLCCADLRDGSIKWKQAADQYGSLMAADGKLIILDGDGDLVIAEANPEKYVEISKAKILQTGPFQHEGPGSAPRCCWTAPVLANGKIYVRDTHGYLACVDMNP